VIVLVLWAIVNAVGLIPLLRRIPAYGLVVRSLWLLVAVAGLVALVNDINALT
jgi:hypothetical protein